MGEDGQGHKDEEMKFDGAEGEDEAGDEVPITRESRMDRVQKRSKEVTFWSLTMWEMTGMDMAA